MTCATGDINYITLYSAMGALGHMKEMKTQESLALSFHFLLKKNYTTPLHAGSVSKKQRLNSEQGISVSSSPDIWLPTKGVRCPAQVPGDPNLTLVHDADRPPHPSASYSP